jgi:hypothetical protein
MKGAGRDGLDLGQQGGDGRAGQRPHTARTRARPCATRWLARPARQWWRRRLYPSSTAAPARRTGAEAEVSGGVGPQWRFSAAHGEGTVMDGVWDGRRLRRTWSSMEVRRKVHWKIKKRTEISHTVTDWCKQGHYGVENDDTNIVVVVVSAGNARGGRKRSPESSPETQHVRTSALDVARYEWRLAKRF